MKSRSTRWSIPVCFGVLGVTICRGVPCEAAPPPSAPDDPAILEEGIHGAPRSFWQLQVGFRTTFVSDPGLDPFAESNDLSQLSLGGTRTVWQMEKISIAPGFFWDYGKRTAKARGDDASLEIHRLAVPLEGRYHLLNGLYLLAKLSPGVVHEKYELRDAMAPATLGDAHWAFSLDASAGAAFLVAPQWSAASSAIRFWIVGEGGYGWTERKSITLRPDLPDDDHRPAGDVPLGSLALRGGFFRLALAVTQ